MLRSLPVFALLLSTAALAHDLPQGAPAPMPAPTPAVDEAAPVAPLPADQAAMKAHVLFLASDAMRGREAGSPEYDIAAQYVAAQFYAAGLRPAGDAGGFLQTVPLVSYKLDGAARFGWTPAGGQSQELALGTDFAPNPNPAQAATAVDAPVVFAGWGLDAKQYGLDSYRGLDVRGKIVAVMTGAPARLGGEERAFFGTPATKAAMAAARGAVGVVMIDNPAAPRRRPVATLVQGLARPRFTWARPDGTGAVESSATPVLGTLSMEAAGRMFGAGWRRVAGAATNPDASHAGLEATGRLAVAMRTAFMPVASSNVVGVVPGSDPTLRQEVVVLSAHLDHIGVSPTGEGDRINNGALDNAIGIASLIEEARRFTAAAKAPRRTVMFLAVTAEEKGLVGSDYFANHPTVPLANIVADVNLDMPILTYRFEDMTVFGADRSTLGPIVRQAVEQQGVGMSPDPMPEEGIFVRSDHFRFVQKGVPSVFLWPGQKGPGKAGTADFMGRCYHRPCDELATLKIDWSQGPRFVGVNYAIAREIADADQRPVWNRGDYFGTLYKGPMAK